MSGIFTDVFYLGEQNVFQLKMATQKGGVLQKNTLGAELFLETPAYALSSEKTNTSFF